MISPVSFDKAFSARLPVGRFFDLGSERGNKGVRHTAFLSNNSLTNEFTVTDRYQLGGSCSAYLMHEGSQPIGALFTTMTYGTVLSDFCLSVVVDGADSFEPSFLLERVNLLAFRGDNGSILIIPKTVDAQYLVRVEKD